MNLDNISNRLVDEPGFVRYGWLWKLIFPNQPIIPHDRYAAIMTKFRVKCHAMMNNPDFDVNPWL